VILDVTFLSQAGPPFEGWEIGISGFFSFFIHLFDENQDSLSFLVTEEKKKKIVDLFQSKFSNKEAEIVNKEVTPENKGIKYIPKKSYQKTMKERSLNCVLIFLQRLSSSLFTDQL
jgi:hypothetical protein